MAVSVVGGFKPPPQDEPFIGGFKPPPQDEPFIGGFNDRIHGHACPVCGHWHISA